MVFLLVGMGNGSVWILPKISLLLHMLTESLDSVENKRISEVVCFLAISKCFILKYLESNFRRSRSNRNGTVTQLMTSHRSVFCLVSKPTCLLVVDINRRRRDLQPDLGVYCSSNILAKCNRD